MGRLSKGAILVARIKVSRAVALVVALALALPVFAVGCAGGMVDENAYVVKQGGKVVGSQKVRIEETTDAIIYSATESRPFAEFETDYTRKLTVTRDLKQIKGYTSSRKVPGATYPTKIVPSKEGDGYSFFANALQTFDYLPLLAQGTSVIIFEPDSACLAQALLDRFLAAEVTQANANLVIPSRGPVVIPTNVERRAKDAMHLAGPGLGELDIEFEKNSFVRAVKWGDIVVQKGGGSVPASSDFAPSVQASRVSEVRVVTPEKLANGDRIELAGSLYFPGGAKKPYKSVILTGDYGPLDRTGTGFMSQIADHLAGQGFAVLTCDRRGIPESKGSYAGHTRDTLLSDINSQVDYLVNRDDMDPKAITLLGWGEGGLLSASAAAANPYVSRLVLMATPSVTLFPDLAKIDTQAMVASGELIDVEGVYYQGLVDGLVGLVSSTTENTAQVGDNKVFMGWMRSWMQATPAADFAALKVPVLVMQGTTDTRVPADQAAAVMAALQARPGGKQKLETFDGLGHGFGKELTQAESSPKRQHPVVEKKVLDALSAWLQGSP